jgi:hypothetical protein
MSERRYQETIGEALRRGHRRIGWTDAEIAEALKDLAYVLGAVRLTATLHPAPDRWHTVEVSHATIFTTEPNDGWDVATSETEL